MINALIVGWDLLELGLDAKAAESIRGDYAARQSLNLAVVENAFSVAVASKALDLLRRYFFQHSREAEGPCEVTMCSRQVAALVLLLNRIHIFTCE